MTPVLHIQIHLYWGDTEEEAVKRATEYCEKFPRWHLYPGVNIRNTAHGQQFVKVTYSVTL